MWCLPWRKNTNGSDTKSSCPGALADRATPLPPSLRAGCGRTLQCVLRIRGTSGLRTVLYICMVHLNGKACRAFCILVIDDCDAQDKKTNENTCLLHFSGWENIKEDNIS